MTTAGDTQPTQPLPGWSDPQPAPRKRRRVWPWIVALIVVIALAVGAWIAGEWIARDVVTTTIREQVITQLDLPADQEIDVVLEGAVLPQLIVGTLEDVTVASDDVELGPLVGDITVHAQDIAIRGEVGAQSATATVVLDADQLRGLLGTLDSFPVDTLELDAPDVTVTTELSLFGLALPVGIALTPSAVDGDIVLSPSSLQLAGNDVSAESLRAQFGGLADAVLRDWPICIREYLPAGVELAEIVVDGDQVVADFALDGAIISDPALQEPGVCT